MIHNDEMIMKPVQVIAADVTVSRIRTADADYWRVTVAHDVAGPAGAYETLTRDHLAWSTDTPDGMLPHEAAIAIC